MIIRFSNECPLHQNEQYYQLYLLVITEKYNLQLGYVPEATSPAGPCPIVCPHKAVSSGLNPSSSTGIPNAVSFASYVRSKSL